MYINPRVSRWKKPAAVMPSEFSTEEYPMPCNPHLLAHMLLQQWNRLTLSEIEQTQYIKRDLALLIEQKYGINHVLAENYLSNIERTLPLAA